MVPANTTTSQPSVSVIVPVRDRSGVRLENCLRSVRWQQIDQTRVEIIVSDFGSHPEHARSIDALAATYACRVRRVATREVWNRSRALNIGIRAATGDYALCTDADMIFAPNFLAAALAAHQRAGDRSFVVCRCHDLPQTVPLQLWGEEDFARLSARASLRQTFGTGACQSAARSFFECVRGYDEKYLFWGKEDSDMLVRALHYGLDLIWIDGATAMLHQWHRKRRPDAPFFWTLNRVRFALTKHRVVKNSDAWGASTG
jgi:glycosyltransferase involved in cell wall biosynthesis